MTSGWLLLLVLLVISSQSVDGQPTTDDETCGGDVLSELRTDMKRLADSQQQILQTLQTLQQQQLLILQQITANGKWLKFSYKR